MISAVLGVVGAVVFGSADFLGGLAAKRLRSITVTAIAAAAGLVGLLVAYPFIGGAWAATDVAWGALSGVFGVIAIVLLYACLAIGPMSILSPLTAVVSAIAPMLWGLLVKGEQLSGFGFLGLFVALVAVVLVGFIPGAAVVRPSLRGILMAIGSGVAIGAFMVSIDLTSDESGLVPLILNRAVNGAIAWTIVAVLVILTARRRRIAPALERRVGATPTGHADLEQASGPAPRTPSPDALAGAVRTGILLAVSCGVVDAVANTVMLIALRLGDLSIVSVLTAMYPAGTIILAAIVLRERIAVVQWIGLALALSAGALFALA
ncbi:MAG TPA: EamA family transporter [Microbacterium sp.]|nr:EamA family transporter [Microbacterium sp.]